METWLITGGAGFIGSNFLKAACSATSAQLIVLDALTYAGNFRSIEALVDDGRVTFVKGSICDRRLLDVLYEQYDITKVVHFAAESHVDRSITDPDSFIKTNILGTYNLLSASRQAWGTNTTGKLFLHVSTDEVFGDLSAEDSPKNEFSPYHPSSPYSASKASSDHLCTAWYRTYDFPVVVTNCSNNYGPYQFPEKLIPLMINQAKLGSELPLYGDGLQIRDWLHVEDHCAALLAVLDQGVAGETYCIGADNEKTNREVIELICDIVDELLERPHGSSRALIASVSDRPGHDRRYALDAGKLRTELNWSPEHEFSEGLRETVMWYLEHALWVEEVTSGSYREYYETQYAPNKNSAESMETTR